MNELLADLILRYSSLDPEDKKLAEKYPYTWSGNVSTNGKRLEYFTRDLLCGSLDMSEKEDKDKAHKDYLSWLGSANHPPDLIIEDGPAIEVKKTTSKAGNLQMNSSHPHQKLDNESDLINKDCKKCEDDIGRWSEKDMLYSIGRIDSGNIDFLWIIYGDCWCGEEELYSELFESVKDSIKNNVENLPYGELNETNELGRVNNVDGANRGSLRIRPMWQIAHPANDYSDHVNDYKNKISDSQPLFFVVQESEYNMLSKNSRNKIESKNNITVKTIEETDPSNSDNNITCKLIIVDAYVDPEE